MDDTSRAVGAASAAPAAPAWIGRALPAQISSGSILIAPHGHSTTQIPQPLQ